MTHSAQTVREQAQQLMRRGAYARAAAALDALPAAERAAPAVVLERVRARMRQGQLRLAESTIAELGRTSAGPGMRLLLQLEAANIQVLRTGDIRGALAHARDIYAGEIDLVDDPVERAEAERVYLRILMSASAYREIDPAERSSALERLPEIAAILHAAGRHLDAYAAETIAAEQIADTAGRVAALQAICESAGVAGYPEVAAEMHLRCADTLITAGGAPDQIVAQIDLAESSYAACAHIAGQIDVRRARARLVVGDSAERAAALEACWEAYDQAELPGAALGVLLDLATLAHQRGDTSGARGYRLRGQDCAEQAGLGLAYDSFQLAEIDLLLRGNDFNGAVERCLSAIAATRSVFFRAGYTLLLSSAYSLLHDADASVRAGREAIQMYVQVGDDDSASDAALKLASDLLHHRRDQDWDMAEALLTDWLEKDRARGDRDAATNKHELLAQIAIQRFAYSPTRQGDSSLLDLAAARLAEGIAGAQALRAEERALRLGGLLQMRGQLCQMRGDEPGVVRAWQDALAVYTAAGLQYQAANCHYILGALALNRANQQLSPAFGESEQALNRALDYYDPAGMRTQAADTRFMLAQLYTNASIHVDDRDLARRLAAAAIEHLSAAEADYDAIRRDYTAGTILDAQRGKQALSARSARIYALAIQTLLTWGSSAEVWGWVQRAKARALTDTLGMSAAAPAAVIAELQAFPEALRLIDREAELLGRLERAAPDMRLPLREELAGVRQQMEQDSVLDAYLALRTGAALELDSLPALLAPRLAPGQRCVCVDWFVVRDRLILLAVRPGEAPEVRQLENRASAVQAFISQNFDRRAIRATLRDTPELLRELDPLVAPLAELTDPGDLLIFAPTASLYDVPLHALAIAGAPLIARNPVVYCPSLSALRHCLARGADGAGAESYALFGDPSGDRTDAAQMVAQLAARLAVQPHLGADVTRASLLSATRAHDLVHFQGHALHTAADPLESHLRLADGALTAREIFGTPGMRSRLMTLAACESASSRIEAGDEPLGLIPALLFAGVGAVVATLWPVHSPATAALMDLFYEALLRPGGPRDHAAALREAVEALRRRPEFEEPYYWAAFVVYGDWTALRRAT